ncbi:tRNA (guanosine(18)-2'-O)-methyltransferase TrmH [Xenorhabdus nematophila]|uniref:tRNA (guanosine(18)-2'-O)-methyltransferase TrmH n=1 Tax=Xenorhabdus nematophila TaxID=628 RepID=UPI000541B273|nr:tRNA (guanosine(18)-2'-O)-methyltransferase TrmH [Xenorhabdus nematophila]CEF29166.1 putative tRNA/rRNA methyltransferase [Xenorhabdus nematophila str. Websteri]AYA41848.1 tRNA (guanosine(18)-2'-O)-methyltransferase TrmH [Xenorhabdus nematophila]MBA0020579.1 tRNA (guanosine(18)-2'-O)-methyltransferase TrmH [Xenorhabdus nematophila]MCB4424636.1 tRNA (guanosine(18)-2'-O)-methyltransferase TrmH [Xenorhabdus nematophila]QNJ36221.1 tRNA (guanosine(18)-2'-O)-methyltransferase TrmH [Xenorhabdus ne
MNPKRYARICQMMAMRQPDLTICLEEVHKPHNVSAVIRTADAIGIHQIHAIWPDQSLRTQLSSAAGSNSWVQVQTHSTIQQAIEQFKSDGMQVLATHLSDKAVDFRQIDYTKPTCIIMGQEKKGISKQAVALADHDIIIPMAGMVQSLNVSVASALILYEAQRQRQLVGMYQREESILSEEEQQKLLFERGYPVLAAVSRRKGLAQPLIDQQGQIIASETWWAEMQSTTAPSKRT